MMQEYICEECGDRMIKTSMDCGWCGMTLCDFCWIDHEETCPDREDQE